MKIKLLYIFIILFLSCNDEIDDPYNHNLIPYNPYNDSPLPLEVGNRWVYYDNYMNHHIIDITDTINYTWLINDSLIVLKTFLVNGFNPLDSQNTDNCYTYALYNGQLLVGCWNYSYKNGFLYGGYLLPSPLKSGKHYFIEPWKELDSLSITTLKTFTTVNTEWSYVHVVTSKKVMIDSIWGYSCGWNRQYYKMGVGMLKWEWAETKSENEEPQYKNFEELLDWYIKR